MPKKQHPSVAEVAKEVFAETPSEGFSSLAEYLAHARDAAKIRGKKVRAMLHGHVAKLVIDYDGQGDSGQVEDVTAFDIHNKKVEIPDKFADEVKEFAYDKLNDAPFDWCNNEGGYGQLTIFMLTGKIMCESHQRIEITEDAEFDCTDGWGQTKEWTKDVSE